MTPESTALWQGIIQPILSALVEYTTVDQVTRLHREAHQDRETPPAVLCVIDALYRLRCNVEHL